MSAHVANSPRTREVPCGVSVEHGRAARTGDDLADDADRLVADQSELLVVDLLDATAVLVGPAAVVAQAGGGLGDIECLGDRARLACTISVRRKRARTVVERLDGGELGLVGLDGLGEGDEELAALVRRALGAPDGVVGLLGGLDGLVDCAMSAVIDATGNAPSAALASETSQIWPLRQCPATLGVHGPSCRCSGRSGEISRATTTSNDARPRASRRRPPAQTRRPVHVSRSKAVERAHNEQTSLDLSPGQRSSTTRERRALDVFTAPLGKESVAVAMLRFGSDS